MLTVEIERNPVPQTLKPQIFAGLYFGQNRHNRFKIHVYTQYTSRKFCEHLLVVYNIQLLHEELGDNDFYGPRWRSHRGP